MNFSPTQLPEIDSVDVVSLRDTDADQISGYMKEAVTAEYFQVVDDLAQQIADLWRQLPPGEQDRCHYPPFGLRFYNNGKLQLQASLCWECNNIFGDLNGNTIWYEFDAQHQISQKLLELCKEVFKPH